jgi:hypothetical protein
MLKESTFKFMLELRFLINQLIEYSNSISKLLFLVVENLLLNIQTLVLFSYFCSSKFLFNCPFLIKYRI